MYGWEIRMQLRHYLGRGVSQAEPSRRCGISRRTIHSWTGSGQLDRDLSSGESRYSPRPRVARAARSYYGTRAALIESLTEATAAGNLSRLLRVFTHPALLVVDEIGYLPISLDGAVLFFQLINARHERASTVLTSYKGFEDWRGVLGDEIMAAALIDRLLHHCHIVNIRGNSYRIRAHQDLFRPAHEERRPETAS